MKVRTADPATMIGDVVSMLHTTHTLKRLGLDTGMDFPTIFRAYLEVIHNEFDFTAEAGAYTRPFFDSM
jgi:aarF domain-containing kinase